MKEVCAQIVACIPSLRRYARGLTGGKDAADDLVQDTLERAWNRIALWQRRDDLRAWLFSILHNLFVDRFRSQRASPVEAMGEGIVESIRPRSRNGLPGAEIRRLNLAEMSHNADYVNSAARSTPGVGCRSAFSGKLIAGARVD